MTPSSISHSASWATLYQCTPECSLSQVALHATCSSKEKNTEKGRSRSLKCRSQPVPAFCVDNLCFKTIERSSGLYLYFCPRAWLRATILEHWNTNSFRASGRHQETGSPQRTWDGHSVEITANRDEKRQQAIEFSIILLCRSLFSSSELLIDSCYRSGDCPWLLGFG